ncbi:lysozyme-like domain-containing protein [Fusarium oxysporum Fo47]|uniref:lysozyme-like domain-containing protein n=1 Tax=Fusarium oxysporum Fo47 TaxID=660027 RepID=UPI002869C055|nr:lysozyme-like domain-containing protein [Fusarium oxysporum Fo47]QKD62394.2 lysozyme-like domain-containing protein [Fusarium oxysporum Fo47]
MRIHIFTVHFLAVASSTAFLITDKGVRCRSGPTTSHAIQRQFTKGTDVTITCQIEGTNIEGNALWDKTTFGCYVSDYYVATGSSGYVTLKFRHNDPIGNPTVGYGHLCDAPQCSEVKYPVPLSVANGKKLLADDMKEFEVCITAMLNSKARLNRNQYGALINPNTVISQEIPHWVYASGQRLPGLVRRRNAEIELAQKPTRRRALPKRC